MAQAPSILVAQEPTQRIALGRFPVFAIGVGILGLALGMGTCAVLLASDSALRPATLTWTGLVLGVSALLCAAPMLLAWVMPAAGWGMGVLGVSFVRTVLAVGGVVAVTSAVGVERKPFVLGVCVGVFVMMMGEALSAVRLLMRHSFSSPGLGAMKGTEQS
jgi:hypothetical protein